MRLINHVIMDPLGMHARPAALMIKTASSFKSEFSLNAKGRTIPLNSILALMTLELKMGDRMKVTVEGPDEVQAAKALRAAMP